MGASEEPNSGAAKVLEMGRRELGTSIMDRRSYRNSAKQPNVASTPALVCELVMRLWNQMLLQQTYDHALCDCGNVTVLQQRYDHTRTPHCV